MTTPFPTLTQGKEQAVTVSVPRDRFVAVSEAQQAKFFKTLRAEPRTFAALQKRAAKLSWFPDCLNTYLGVISDKLEALAPDLPDDRFMGFVDWVLLQGHGAVQALLDADDLAAVPEFWCDGQLRLAQGHWMQRGGANHA